LNLRQKTQTSKTPRKSAVRLADKTWGLFLYGNKIAGVKLRYMTV
jgi:hypothetical protein